MAKNLLVEERNGELFSLQTKIIEPGHSRKALSPLAWKILQELSKEPSYPKKIAERIKVHEQKVYYHIRNLKKAGFIKFGKEENINGVIAKYYELEKPSFSMKLKESEPMKGFLLPSNSRIEHLVHPFVEDGSLNSLIVIGSPEPHGPTKARGKDALYAINLGIFLGGFLNQMPQNPIRLDTEITKDELKKNLILIGGPGVNRLSAMINPSLPVRFREYQKHQYSEIFSTISKKSYTEDECGLIVKIKSPFEKGRHILLLAGKRSFGTRAAMLAFTKNIEGISRGNNHSKNVFAKVVEGIDSDSDGLIDSIEIRE